jgi:hypothetical protein
MVSAGQRDAPVIGATQPLVLRFHHLHYRAADPGAALGDAAARLGGTRVVAPGLGVGVRVARQYVLFERDREDSPAADPVSSPAEAYGEAVAWLRARGLAAQPASLAETAVASGLPLATFDHIGFAADDPAAVVTALKESPVSALRRLRDFGCLQGSCSRSFATRTVPTPSGVPCIGRAIAGRRALRGVRHDARSDSATEHR